MCQYFGAIVWLIIVFFMLIILFVWAFSINEPGLLYEMNYYSGVIAMPCGCR